MSRERNPAGSYGDVTAEYLALRTAAGCILHTHDAVTVRGVDAESFLQGIISQDLTAVAPGAVTRSLLLGPQGKVRAVFWVLKGTDEILLLTDFGSGEDVAAELDRYRFRVTATVEMMPDAVHSVVGPSSVEVLGEAGYPVPAGWEGTSQGWVCALPLGGLPRYALIGIEPEILIAAGARRVGALAARAVRVEAGEPIVGRDLDDKTIPQESGLVPDTVSFDKGCYVGQELVARIDSRGRVNRHLRGIVIGANVLPPEQAELWIDETMVGRLTSVAESLTLRAPIGLSLVRRQIEPGTDVEIRWDGGSTTATVRKLPLSDFTES